LFLSDIKSSFQKKYQLYNKDVLPNVIITIFIFKLLFKALMFA